MDKLYYLANTKAFIHRKIAAEHVLISVGDNIATFNGYIQLNESAAFLWDSLKHKKTVSELENALFQEYELDMEKAHEDVARFLHMLLENGMVMRVE